MDSQWQQQRRRQLKSRQRRPPRRRRQQRRNNLCKFQLSLFFRVSDFYITMGFFRYRSFKFFFYNGRKLGGRNRNRPDGATVRDPAVLVPDPGFRHIGRQPKKGRSKQYCNGELRIRVRRPGLEPGFRRWQRLVITTTLSAQCALHCG